MQTHIGSDPDTGDWSKFVAGYSPGSTFRGMTLPDGMYVLEHASGVAFQGAMHELESLMDDGLQHLAILSRRVNAGKVVPASLPESLKADVELAYNNFGQACDHENGPVILRGHYRYCAQCGVRTGATQ